MLSFFIDTAKQKRLKRRLSVTFSDDEEDIPNASSNKRKSIDLSADEKEESSVTAKAKKPSQCSSRNLILC
jgi:hypothetical protein